MHQHKSNLAAVLLCALLIPALAACGDDSTSAADATTGSATADTPASPAATQADALGVTDPWVKAATQEDQMTGAFAVLVNDSDREITVVGATSTVNELTELHETVQNADGSMAMQPKDGGFVLPAGGTLELAPGGDHIMLMGLSRSLAAGATVEITLSLGDGSTKTVQATVKPFTGADENYQNGATAGNGDMGDMGDMGDTGDMGDMGGEH